MRRTISLCLALALLTLSAGLVQAATVTYLVPTATLPAPNNEHGVITNPAGLPQHIVASQVTSPASVPDGTQWLENIMPGTDSKLCSIRFAYDLAGIPETAMIRAMRAWMYVGANPLPASRACATLNVGTWWNGGVSVSTGPLGEGGLSAGWMSGPLVALPASYQPASLAKGSLVSGLLMYATRPPSLAVYATIIEVHWDPQTP